MKKTALIALLLITSMIQVQGQAFKENDIIISAGYGFPNVSNQWYYRGNAPQKSLGPFHGKIEFALSNKIGVGASVNYSNLEVTSPYYYYNSSMWEKQTFNTFSWLARINIHMGNKEKFDPYLGIGLGYRNTTYKITSNSPYGNYEGTYNYFPFGKYGFETTVGARFFITNHIGLYFETGAAQSVVQTGITCKF